MSVVSLLGVKIINNPAPFSSSYEFEITFECLEPLLKDLEWKLTYVGSATSSDYDQELDTLLVGPIPVGINKFIFEANPPDLSRIPSSEVLGVTVILLTCSYDGREFVRVGYYVNNEYDTEELNADPPSKPVMEHVRRNILAEKPRVTRFAIKWDSEESAPAEFPPDQPEADALPADGDQYGAEEEDEELEDEEAKPEGEDEEMAGAEDTAGAGPSKEEASGDESEDLEAESSGSEDEDEDEEEEAEDEDMEMADDDDQKQSGGSMDTAAGHVAETKTQGEVMVH